MLAKLEWEIRQATIRSVDQKAVGHHAVNATLFAWHLTDWAWSAVDRHPRIRLLIGRELAISPAEVNFDRFRLWVKQRQPRLDVCEAITNGVKHAAVGVVEGESNSVEFRTSAATGPQDMKIRGPDGRVALTINMPPMWIPKFVVSGEKIEALPMLKEIAAFWKKFLNDNAIDG